MQLETVLVSSEDEILQIHQLNQENLRDNLPESEKKEQGFVSWHYPVGLLRKMHELAPSVITKDGDKVVAYALSLPKEASAFHRDLQTMFDHFGPIPYQGRSLLSYTFYCMGQICVDKRYRGKGIVQDLYQKHKDIYSSRYELFITEISLNNPRSQRAHEKVGFKVIHTYRDAMDEWNVVVWDWMRE